MSEIAGIGFTGFVVLGLVAVGMYGCPQYNVYSQRMSGQAELAKAEQNRQIKVKTAEAERDAAKLQAEAIKIVGEAAKQYPEYRHQEFLSAFGEALREGKMNQIVYVPTEANIPVMEAGRRPE